MFLAVLWAIITSVANLEGVGAGKSFTAPIDGNPSRASLLTSATTHFREFRSEGQPVHGESFFDVEQRLSQYSHKFPLAG